MTVPVTSQADQQLVRFARGVELQVVDSAQPSGEQGQARGRRRELGDGQIREHEREVHAAVKIERRGDGNGVVGCVAHRVGCGRRHGIKHQPHVHTRRLRVRASFIAPDEQRVTLFVQPCRDVVVRFVEVVVEIHKVVGGAVKLVQHVKGSETRVRFVAKGVFACEIDAATVATHEGARARSDVAVGLADITQPGVVVCRVVNREQRQRLFAVELSRHCVAEEGVRLVELRQGLRTFRQLLWKAFQCQKLLRPR